MLLDTFLEGYDFSAKIIVPFTTYAGSGFSRTERTIQTIFDGLFISANSVSSAQSDTATWIKGLNL